MSASETEPVTEPDTDEATEDEGEDEAAEDEGDSTEDEPTEPEALAAPAQTDKEIEKRIGQLDAEAKRHAKRVNEILGEDALGLVLCEACPPNTPGFHYPAAMFPEGSPERVLYSQLAGGDGAEHRHPDYFKTCDECNGYGTVLTGAQLGLITHEISCPVCKTQGYIDLRGQEGAPQMATAPLNGSVTDPVVDPAALDDMWGRPFGHPRHGKFPIYLTPAERAEDLAAGFSIG